MTWKHLKMYFSQQFISHSGPDSNCIYRLFILHDTETYQCNSLQVNGERFFSPLKSWTVNACRINHPIIHICVLFIFRAAVAVSPFNRDTVAVRKLKWCIGAALTFVPLEVQHIFFKLGHFFLLFLHFFKSSPLYIYQRNLTSHLWIAAMYFQL